MSIQKANKNEVRKEIAALIDRIKEQSDRIGTQREIPQSELDVILHRIEELHRRTIVWSYLNTLPEEVEKEQDWVDNIISVKVEDEVVEPAVSVEQNTPSVVSEIVSSPEKKTEAVQEENKIQDAPPLVKPVEVTSTIINPVIPEKQEVPVVTAPPVSKPVALKDVRSFIGFNEKLMYLRQLFGGDATAYDEALNQINIMDSFAEAQAYLSLLAGEYKWNKDHEAVTIFQLTVKRRFS